MTIAEDAKRGLITGEMTVVPKADGVTVDFIRRGMLKVIL